MTSALGNLAGPDERHARAAEFIWRLWQDGGVATDFPPALKPSTRAQGYAVQAELDRLSGNTCVGWKIAATSAAGQKHIGVDGPLAGRIFSARVLQPGATTSIATNRMRVAEPEFAYRLGRSLPPRPMPYTTTEVMAAVGSLHLALELPASRFTDFAAVGGPALIADNACAHELVLGPAVSADWRGLDLSRHKVVARVGARYSRDGIGANVLGDPQLALTWLVNELAGLGIAVGAGAVVTTGTCMTPLTIVEGDHVTADFGVLGTIRVTIANA
jgi:2-keto-4-pentenoate hydratase